MQILNFDECEHARGDCNLLALETVRLPSSVHFFVMVTNNREHHLKGLQREANSLANDWMTPQNELLGARQSGRLEQNRIRHRNFSDIVHNSRPPQRLDLRR